MRPSTTVRSTLPCTGRPSKGEFFDLLWNCSGVDPPGAIGIEQHQIGGGAQQQAPGRQAEKAGRRPAQAVDDLQQLRWRLW